MLPVAEGLENHLFQSGLSARACKDDERLEAQGQDEGRKQQAQHKPGDEAGAAKLHGPEANLAAEADKAPHQVWRPEGSHTNHHPLLCCDI
jgi:hypothetical protein